MMVTVGLCVACCALLGVSSAAHQRQHLDRAMNAFTDVGRELGVI